MNSEFVSKQQDDDDEGGSSKSNGDSIDITSTESLLNNSIMSSLSFWKRKLKYTGSVQLCLDVCRSLKETD